MLEEQLQVRGVPSRVLGDLSMSVRKARYLSTGSITPSRPTTVYETCPFDIRTRWTRTTAAS